MERIGIMYQEHVQEDATVPTDFVVHTYPFASMPLLKSHVHPKFAVYELGRKLFEFSGNLQQTLVRDTPVLGSILQIYMAWDRALSDENLEDLEFNEPPDDDDDKSKNPSYPGRAPSIRTAPGRANLKRSRWDPPDSPSACRTGQPPSGRAAANVFKTIRSSVPTYDQAQRVKEWATSDVYSETAYSSHDASSVGSLPFSSPGSPDEKVVSRPNTPHDGFKRRRCELRPMINEHGSYDGANARHAPAAKTT